MLLSCFSCFGTADVHLSTATEILISTRIVHHYFTVRHCAVFFSHSATPTLNLSSYHTYCFTSASLHTDAVRRFKAQNQTLLSNFTTTAFIHVSTLIGSSSGKNSYTYTQKLLVHWPMFTVFLFCVCITVFTSG
jgi:hypothetical protein